MATAAGNDYYAVLGVDPEATAEEVKKAFRALARRYHPDATGGHSESAERYKEISEAYAVLSDPVRRREYDAGRLSRGGMWSPFASTIEDIFESFFGAGTARQPRRPTRARQGESVELELELGFAEAVFGTERTLELQRYEACSRCGGNGCEPGSHPVRCDRCEGTGEVRQVRRSAIGSLVTSYPCSACQATGQAILSPCQLCGGSGRVGQEVEIPIAIPPGMEDGDRLRLSGEGEAGSSGGGRGDLYVRFAVRPDDRFVRSGDDLVTWLEVPVTVAALGGQITFESLDGPERIAIPKGAQSGEVFRVPGRGQPRRRGRGRGDLLVHAQVVTPTGLDAGQEDLLRKLAQARGEVEGGGGLLGRLRRALGFEG